MKIYQKHGKSYTRIYQAWHSMKTRFYNSHYHGYLHYGGRGIKVCERWHQFENFYYDLGEIPPGLEVDRIDTDKNYEPGNVRFVTRTENTRNTRKSRWWFIDGHKFPSSYAAAEYFRKNKKTIRNWCNGITHKGKWYPPREGCWSEAKYA